MILATQKDIERDLKTSLYLYKSEYDNLDMEESLNFLTQLIYVITESEPAMGYYNFTWDEIDNELTSFLDPFYFDYCIEKFKHQTNEFEFWRLFFFETMTGGIEYKGIDYAYTKERLFSIINEKPDELIPYFPFNAFPFAGELTPEEHARVYSKIKQLIIWVENQPLTMRVRTVGGFLDYTEPLVSN